MEITCNSRTVKVEVSTAQLEYVAILTGLRPFTSFNCSAKVRNNAGDSESTDVQVFSTQQDGEF